MTLRIYKQYDTPFYNVEVWDSGFMLNSDSGLLTRNYARDRGNEMINQLSSKFIIITNRQNPVLPYYKVYDKTQERTVAKFDHKEHALQYIQSSVTRNM